MKVAVPIVTGGSSGHTMMPKHMLHGQMHYDIPGGRVVFTDSSFTPEELALPDVQVLEGSPEETEPVKQKGGSKPRTKTPMTPP